MNYLFLHQRVCVFPIFHKKQNIGYEKMGFVTKRQKGWATIGPQLVYQPSSPLCRTLSRITEKKGLQGKKIITISIFINMFVFIFYLFLLICSYFI